MDLKHQLHLAYSLIYDGLCYVCVSRYGVRIAELNASKANLHHELLEEPLQYLHHRRDDYFAIIV